MDDKSAYTSYTAATVESKLSRRVCDKPPEKGAGDYEDGYHQQPATDNSDPLITAGNNEAARCKLQHKAQAINRTKN